MKIDTFFHISKGPGTRLVVCCRYSGAYKMAGSRSFIKEGDLAPMCFQLIDFQMVAKLTVPGPTGLTERSVKQAQKKEKPFDFSLVVDYTGKISNLWEDIKKVERFAQYIENQGNGKLTEMEVSQK